MSAKRYVTKTGKTVTDADVEKMAQQICWDRQMETGERCDAHPMDDVTSGNIWPENEEEYPW